MRHAFNRLEEDPDEPARRDRAHGDLLAALRLGDPEIASRALVQHLSGTAAIVLRAIDDRPALSDR